VDKGDAYDKTKSPFLYLRELMRLILDKDPGKVANAPSVEFERGKTFALHIRDIAPVDELL